MYYRYIVVFFFNDTATTEIYTLSLHDALPFSPHDATLCMRDRGFDGPILIDTGTQDQFLDLLKPEALAEAAAAKRQQMTFRRSEEHTSELQSPM